MSADQLTLLFELVLELGALAGFLGAMIYAGLRGLCAFCWREFEATQWWQDYCDRAYVRELNAQADKDLAAVNRALSKQAGRVQLAALCFFVVALLSFLAACAAPEPHLTGSYHWWEQVKRGW